MYPDNYVSSLKKKGLYKRRMAEARPPPKAQVKCTFGLQQNYTAPVYDDRQAHVHLWKSASLINGLEYEQNPLRKTKETKIPVNKNKQYCTICHCIRPFVFKMRDISLRPPDETWIDNYNSRKRKQPDDDDGVSANFKLLTIDEADLDEDDVSTVFGDLTIKESTGMDRVLEDSAADYFQGYVEAVGRDDFTTALPLIIKCQSLVPKNMGYLRNVTSALEWLQSEHSVVLKEYHTIRSKYASIWTKPTGKQEGLPHHFSESEKQWRAELREEIMKPVDVTHDKTRRRKIRLSAEAMALRERHYARLFGNPMPTSDDRETATKRRELTKTLSAICHPLLRRPSIDKGYIIMKKNVQY